MVCGSIHMSAIAVGDFGLLKLILAAGVAFRHCSWLSICTENGRISGFQNCLSTVTEALRFS